MIFQNTRLKKDKYRNIFIVQDRNYWKSNPYEYDKDMDLLLTYDFGLIKDISQKGGDIEYIDHIIKSDYITPYHYNAYNFFYNWQNDEKGNDIFLYKGIKVSDAFMIEIWDYILHYTRLLVSFSALKVIASENIYVGLSLNSDYEVLDIQGIKYQKWTNKDSEEFTEYYFNIFKWMKENVYPKTFKNSLKMFLAAFVDKFLNFADSMENPVNRLKRIFIIGYYPTFRIIEKLKKDGKSLIILPQYTWTKEILKERRIPLSSKIKNKYREIADNMLQAFPDRKFQKIIIENTDVSEYFYTSILKKFTFSLPRYLSIIDAYIGFFSKKKLDLMISMSSLGANNKLLLNFCEKKNIPTYMIINGLLWGDYLLESKECTWINSYSESVKLDYFKGMENIVCLGDPRMDQYKGMKREKELNSEDDISTIVIGAGGFNLTDLNSYVAYEFDYIYDILHVLQEKIQKGRKIKILIKVRANAYEFQYTSLIKEYFPGLSVEVIQKIPIKEVLVKADLYISPYSQTIIEAASIGIPVIYYKKDTEICGPPFNCKSELVTSTEVEDLSNKIELFFNNDEIYEEFKKPEILEKYIGPLDGKNLERNINFIYSILEGNAVKNNI
jgi:hypothetical protein